MRSAAIFLLLSAVFLGGCSREQDFEERYSAAEAKLKIKAKQMDTEISKQLRAEPGALVPADDKKGKK
jgi:PBP1b-binding outer membrane lipoprotein LpoB